MVVDDRFFMSLAINEAWKYQFLTYPNPAVGAVVVKNESEILSIEAHKKAGSAHAEVEAIKKAYIKLSNNNRIKKLKTPEQIHQFLYNNHNNLFKDCKIYVTLEPCMHYGKTPPCSLLIKTLGFKEVIIGSTDPNKKASGAIKYLKAHNINIKRVLKNKCNILIEPFLQWSKKRFIFFKHAQTLNGAVKGGYISSKKTLHFVHQIRDKIDLIVIGGNTVRIDRPRLDSRLCNGAAPDVLIFSREKKFDKSIPLFKVKNRKVFISDNLNLIKSYNFIMIEGISELYQKLSKITHWHLSLISPKLRKTGKFNANANEVILHEFKKGKDLVVFLKSKEG